MCKIRTFLGKARKKPKRVFLVSAFLKDWRQPILAESIKPLPSARLCLTAEFGMGSGRSTTTLNERCKHLLKNLRRRTPVKSAWIQVSVSIDEMPKTVGRSEIG